MKHAVSKIKILKYLKKISSQVLNRNSSRLGVEM